MDNEKELPKTDKEKYPNLTARQIRMIRKICDEFADKWNSALLAGCAHTQSEPDGSGV